MKKQKIVLAFSGGLDTSYCVVYLTKVKNLEVNTITVNTGGFSLSQSHELATHARKLGAREHKTIDVTDAYYYKCIRYLVYGNVLKNQTYPLSVSAERVFQAIAVANHALKIEADFVAHGSTGAGNDQVRFDIIFHTLAPQLAVITPIRDQSLSRTQEIQFLKKQGIDLDWSKSCYSVNQGLWGTTIGGKETLTSNKTLPESAFPTKIDATGPEKISLQFKKGQICGLDDRKFENAVEAIQTINKKAAAYGIGRDLHTGDTIIGIKGRVGFEAAAPILIIKAHQALEKHVLTKWQMHWKDQLANWYGLLLHEGQYFDPVMRDIEVFLEHTQNSVEGSVHIELAPHRFRILGIESPFDMMSARFAQYGEKQQTWEGQDVRGFAKIAANQSKIHRIINKKSTL